MTYNPTRQETKDNFFISFSKAVELVCQKHKHFIHDPAFELYVKIDEYEEENEDQNIKLKAMVNDNETYNDNMKTLEDELDEAFNGV